MNKPMDLIHLGHVPAMDFPRFVLICGDPDRVEIFSDLINNFKVIIKKRGFVVATGITIENNIPITVAGTGLGGPTTAAILEELILLGTKIVIRVGTCGSYQPEMQQDDLLISHATIRHDGTSQSYTGRIGLGFPAVADLDVTYALRIAARDLNIRHYTGITRHIDGFYPDNFPEFNLFPDDLRAMKQALTKAHVLGVSMESGTIFPLCYLRKVKAGEILAVTDKADQDQHEQVQGQGVQMAIKTALKAVLYLNEQFPEL